MMLDRPVPQPISMTRRHAPSVESRRSHVDVRKQRPSAEDVNAAS
jgi:hypothetical protein